jgi:hypothetical protein
MTAVHADLPHRFEMGAGMVTPKAMQVLDKFGLSPFHLMSRHLSGDWGDIPDADKRLNEHHLKVGLSLHSAYTLAKPGMQARLLVITEADRSATTVLTPEEY